jgi:hypothetical protein
MCPTLQHQTELCTKKHLGKHLASYRLGKSNLWGRVWEEAMPIPKQVDSPMSIGPSARHVFSYFDNSPLDLHILSHCRDCSSFSTWDYWYQSIKLSSTKSHSLNEIPGFLPFLSVLHGRRKTTYLRPLSAGVWTSFSPYTIQIKLS